MMFIFPQNEILSGEILPGNTLSENELARRLKDSHTLFFKALDPLTYDRSLNALTQRGRLIRKISYPEEIEAFYMYEQIS